MSEYTDGLLAWIDPEIMGGRRATYTLPTPTKGNHMSNINPNNYDGTTVTLVGRAGGPVEVKEFKNGNQAQLNIAVGKGYKNKQTDEWVDTGTDWYTLTATADYAQSNWPNVGKGDKVRVDDARLELKGYVKGDGTAGVDATLRFGTLVVVEAKDNTKAPW